jgi:pimeloyl-ACP methyl ester carboxylesterase
VLVPGSMSDHTAFEPPVGELRDEFRIFAMDRRGFGASLESPSYSAEREFSDVAAVVDAVAGQTGRSVVLFGHSWGGSCALGASPHLPSLRAVVLYEPSLGLQYPPGAIDRIEERVAAGDNEGAVIEMLTGVAGLTEDEIAERRAAPNWPERVATAPRSPGGPHHGPNTSAPPVGFESTTQGLGMRLGAPSKIVNGRHKYVIRPSGKYFAITVRPAESVHHLPQSLKLLRPRSGLASHDHLGITR